MYKVELLRRRHRILIVILLLQMQDVNRSVWVDPYNKLCDTKGEYARNHQDLRHSAKRFKSEYRMTLEKFEELLDLVTPKLRRKWTFMQSPLSVEHKLVITLRYVCFCQFVFFIKNKICHFILPSGKS